MPGAEADVPGDYGSYLIPGVLAMVIMFATILSSISLIQDRHEGFLQSVLVSPTPRWVLVLSKIIGGGIVAMIQVELLLLGLLLFSPTVGVTEFLAGSLACVLICIALSGLGLAAAWYVDSIAGFPGVMNLLLMPMWLLSGAFFPVEGASTWLRLIMTINPLAWGVDALGGALGVYDSSGVTSWLLTALFAAASVGLAVVVMSGTRRS